MTDVRGDQATSDEFRRTQNWIGRPGSTLATVSFIPPLEKLSLVSRPGRSFFTILNCCRWCRLDTEGETAIDVFYITRDGAKLDAAEQKELKRALLAAMKANAG